MKITAFDPRYTLRVSQGDISGSSTGSNGLGGFGGDVTGSDGDLSVVALRQSVSLGSNLGTGVSIGDTLTIISTAGTPVARFATPSNTVSLGSNAMTRTTGGQGRTTSIAASGSAQTLMIGGANYFDLTLTANCVVSFTGWAPSGYLSEIGVRTTENGTGGWTPTFSGVTWIGGSAPAHTTTASTSTEYLFWTDDGGATVIGGQVGAGSSASPLTTKGDLYAYSTTNARFAVGSNGTGIIADSAETLGMRWTLRALSGELLMADGVTAPPVPIESDPSQDDWLFADL